MSAHAIIVLCPTRPDLLGQPLLGHVAWGFQLPNNEWVIGAVEGDGWPRGNRFNGFWSRKVPSFNAALQHFANMKYEDAEYNQFKLLTVTHNVFPDPDAAMSVMKWVSGQKYELFGRNCMNSAYDILRAFSRGGNFNSRTMPSPDTNWIPNGWYNAIAVSNADHRCAPAVQNQASDRQRDIEHEIRGAREKGDASREHHAAQPRWHLFEQHSESIAFAVNRDTETEVDALADVAEHQPDWRDPSSDNYLPIDAEATEKAEKPEIYVDLPSLSLEEFEKQGTTESDPI